MLVRNVDVSLLSGGIYEALVTTVEERLLYYSFILLTTTWFRK